MSSVINTESCADWTQYSSSLTATAVEAGQKLILQAAGPGDASTTDAHWSIVDSLSLTTVGAVPRTIVVCSIVCWRVRPVGLRMAEAKVKEVAVQRSRRRRWTRASARMHETGGRWGGISRLTGNPARVNMISVSFSPFSPLEVAHEKPFSLLLFDRVHRWRWSPALKPPRLALTAAAPSTTLRATGVSAGVPAAGDQADISNGYSATLNSAVTGQPASLWVGNAGHGRKPRYSNRRFR